MASVNCEEEKSESTCHVNGEKYVDKCGLVSETGKNLTWLLCPHCDSKVLQPNKGEYLEKEHVMPFVSAKHEVPEESERETLSQFWLVIDMYTFENVGFSKTVNTTKYLICADCEIGPIGFVNLEDRSKHYVALSRVKHQ